MQCGKDVCISFLFLEKEVEPQHLHQNATHNFFVVLFDKGLHNNKSINPMPPSW
jgi:hypothetical protein